MNRTTLKLSTLALSLGLSALSFSAFASEGYYDAFGQKAGITSIIDDFVGNVAADNRINAYFAHANIPFLKASLVNQVCEALGGPCKYTGPAMGPLHHSMGVTQAAFNALTEDLQLSMTKYNVPIPAQNHLIGILAPMSKDIITK
jgi:hemoglobin